jgi:hypothetical protein
MFRVMLSIMKTLTSDRMTMQVATVAAWILLTLPAATWADSMRCGKWVVSETSSSAEILQKCGEPQQKEVAKADVVSRNLAGYVTKVGVKVTERWRYQASNRALPMLVTIIDGKVVRIERTE